MRKYEFSVSTFTLSFPKLLDHPMQHISRKNIFWTAQKFWSYLCNKLRASILARRPFSTNNCTTESYRCLELTSLILTQT